ncbi:endonuclease III [Fulvimarina sp. 2208YS6-2-32]|uniref:Endonuclease III n=1 Tax=Fulvimarina uroteuthidis TaxID=3098149 RepID=A0ABU5I6I7_9HYPH|nr:endonuclease III [Fulvimarina sp. 2208YS6-2-32]MDY8111000.1 endonuclease III [Fulvimarina sp. 2208YS6-2-32]
MTRKIISSPGRIKAAKAPGDPEPASGATAAPPTPSATAPARAPAGARPKPGPARRGPRIPYTKLEIAEIFRRFAVQRPEPQPELEHSNPFTLLVAVVLSAQATDAGVNKATRGLFAAASDAGAMAALGEDAIREHVRTIGLFRNKARNVHALSLALVERHGGEVPSDRASLEALPGVGRKTANVVLNTAFGEETLAVDTHIFRIGNRLKLAPGKSVDEVEQGFLTIIPPQFRRHAHHWLILHGRYVCKARKPECALCVIADLCRADVKTTDVPAELRELGAGLLPASA